MKKQILHITLFFFFVGLQPLTAQRNYTANDVSNLFSSQKRIYAPEQGLSSRHIARLEQQIRILKQDLNIEAGVIFLPEVKATAFTSDFREYIFRKWEIENKRALLFLFIYGTPDLMIGEDLQKEIPNILRWHIVDEMKEQETRGKGLIKGIKHLTYLLKNETAKAELIQKLEQEDQDTYELGVLVIKIVAVLFAIFLIYMGYDDFQEYNSSNAYVRALKWQNPYWLRAFPILGFAIFYFPITLLYLIIWWLLKQKYTRLTCEKCGSSKLKLSKLKFKKKQDYVTFSFLCENCNYIHSEEGRFCDFK